MIETLGGRKMILSVLSLIALVVLSVAKPEAVTAELIAGLLGIVGSFSLANAATTIKSVVAGPAASEVEVAPAPQTAQIEAAISQQQQQLNQMADIILKLTATQKPATISIEPQQKGNADANREAIQQYLSSNFGQQG